MLTIAGWLRDLTMEKRAKPLPTCKVRTLDGGKRRTPLWWKTPKVRWKWSTPPSAICSTWNCRRAIAGGHGLVLSCLRWPPSPQDQQIAPIYFPLDSPRPTSSEFEFTGGKHAEQHSMPVTGETGIAGRLHFVSRPASATASAQRRRPRHHRLRNPKRWKRLRGNLATAVENAGAIHRAEQPRFTRRRDRALPPRGRCHRPQFNEIHCRVARFSQIAPAEVKLGLPNSICANRSPACSDNVVADAENASRAVELVR